MGRIFVQLLGSQPVTPYEQEYTNMRNFLMMTSLVIAATATTGAQAQSSQTQTIDRPNYEITRTDTRDAAAGTASRDLQVVRKSDGAVATSSLDRTRDGAGTSSITASQTGFDGQSRNANLARMRTDTGTSVTGSATGRDGRSLDYSAGRTRTDDGISSNRLLTTSEGRSFGKERTRTREQGQFRRSGNSERGGGLRQGRRPRR